ncbi:collagen alpha-1(III) chain-like [Trachemys scripta elegans]|uniref:collagen alpha-1(III) chain-like n=1 Tax=Trachemys scripta elegans TaxID=31138 RepID=UPI00155181E5|nr:collagen alpha-1(III) chain-like [Trachemys scripta elegans]
MLPLAGPVGDVSARLKGPRERSSPFPAGCRGQGGYASDPGVIALMGPRGSWLPSAAPCGPPRWGGSIHPFPGQAEGASADNLGHHATARGPPGSFAALPCPALGQPTRDRSPGCRGVAGRGRNSRPPQAQEGGQWGSRPHLCHLPPRQRDPGGGGGASGGTEQERRGYPRARSPGRPRSPTRPQLDPRCGVAGPAGGLTASTACCRMEVSLENILSLDWSSRCREDRESSSIRRLRSRVFSGRSSQWAPGKVKCLWEDRVPYPGPDGWIEPQVEGIFSLGVSCLDL